MTKMTTPGTLSRSGGFTLIEVMVAILISSMVMVAVSASFLGTMNAHYEIDNANSVMSDGQRVLDIMERDLRSIWHYGIKKNRVLFGRSRDIGGFDADRIDVIASTDSIEGVVDLESRIGHPGICEVGYWLRDNRESPGLLELCRREDPFVDDDMTLGGKFQRVSDRVKSLNITYYATLGYDAEPLDEWDSAAEGKMPRRIKLELKLHRRIGNRNQVSGVEISDDQKILETYVRHIVLDRRYEDILQAGIAMIPTAPVAPEDQPTAAGGGSENGGGGGGGGGGARTGGAGGGIENMVGAGGRANQGRGGQGGPGGNRGGAGGRGGQPPSGGPPIDLGGLLRGGGNLPGGAGGLFGSRTGSGNPFGGASR